MRAGKGDKAWDDFSPGLSWSFWESLVSVFSALGWLSGI